MRVTCLDYSPVCIDMMKIAYGSAYPNVDFVVGDATDLASVTWNGGGAGAMAVPPPPATTTTMATIDRWRKMVAEQRGGGGTETSTS